MDDFFSLTYPPAIHYGWGCRRELAGVMAGHGIQRPLLVATRSHSGESERRLWQQLCDVSFVHVIAGVPHDPSLESVDEIIAAGRELAADAVVAVGGGSVIDAAKAAAALVPRSGWTGEYYRGEREIDSPGLPLLALPTTAGTGAEMTRNAVLSDPRTGEKKSLRSPHMIPSVALVDPELTVSMPPGLTAASGLDAFTQAVESFLSARANAVSRPLALEAAGILFHALPLAYREGENQVARERVARGSLLSALAFSQSGLGAVHGLAHPIGSALELPHGLTCAILLPHVLEWNLPACREDLATLAGHCAGEQAEGLVVAVRELTQTLGIPSTFAEFGLAAEHIPFILSHCRSGSMKATPRPMNDEDIEELLQPLM